MTDSPAPFMPVPVPACLPLTREKEAELRAAVIREALSWDQTPYRKLQDRKGAGIDCAMLLVRAWVDSGIFQPFDPRPYPPDWHLHKPKGFQEGDPGYERYLGWMCALAREVEKPQPGDVVIWRFGWCFSHGGIIVNDKLHVIHALSDHGKCTLSDLDEAFLRWDRGKGRPRKFFDVFAPLREATP